MYNWMCTSCEYTTESERCPACKYANCRGCHILEYATKPPAECPRCQKATTFIDLDDEEHAGKH